MNAFEVSLSPRVMGAEVLTRIAHEGLGGTLFFGPPRRRTSVQFSRGRPEGGRQSSGAPMGDRAHVVAAVRAFGALSKGRCQFDGKPPTVETSMRIDTLGEALMAALHSVTAVQLDAFWAARGDSLVHAEATFDRVANAIERLLDARFVPPAPGTRVADLVRGLDAPVQRGYAAMIMLGALGTDAPPFELVRPVNPAVLQGEGGAEPGGGAIDQNDTEALAREICDVHERLVIFDHYSFLGVPRDAPAEAIRKAYFALAKRWHTDRLAALKLPPDVIQLAEDLFRSADEAHQTLADAKTRSEYDWVLDRQAQGLPTDPAVILGAESVFLRAQGLVRRGQAKNAEPLLRQAVAMNPGEPEFFVYLGYAIYATQGSRGVKEARGVIQKGLAMNDRLDTAHEFLGRIARAEGDLEDAREHLKKALAINRKNKDVERELRLLDMRQRQAAGQDDAKREKPVSRLLGWMRRR